MHWYRAVALDLDGTLTTGGWPAPAVLDAIATVRDQGVRVLLVTGRILSELDVEFPGHVDPFDLVVAENGCVQRTADGTRLLADPVEPALLDRLHAVGIGVSRGQVLLATAADADHIALDAIVADAVKTAETRTVAPHSVHVHRRPPIRWRHLRRRRAGATPGIRT